MIKSSAISFAILFSTLSSNCYSQLTTGISFMSGSIDYTPLYCLLRPTTTHAYRQNPVFATGLRVPNKQNHSRRMNLIMSPYPNHSASFSRVSGYTFQFYLVNGLETAAVTLLGSFISWGSGFDAALISGPTASSAFAYFYTRSWEQQSTVGELEDLFAPIFLGIGAAYVPMMLKDDFSYKARENAVVRSFFIIPLITTVYHVTKALVTKRNIFEPSNEHQLKKGIQQKSVRVHFLTPTILVSPRGSVGGFEIVRLRW